MPEERKHLSDKDKRVYGDMPEEAIVNPTKPAKEEKEIDPEELQKRIDKMLKSK